MRFVSSEELKLIRGSVKAVVPLSAYTVRVSRCDPILDKSERAQCICLQDESQRWLPVSSAVVRKKPMPVKADLKTVSVVQESSIKVPPFPF